MFTSRFEITEQVEWAGHETPVKPFLGSLGREWVPYSESVRTYWHTYKKLNYLLTKTFTTKHWKLLLLI